MLALLTLPVVCACCAAAVAAEPGKAQRPNILFLITDDQRADTIGALGNRRIETPNLDGLARRGLVFDNAYCMGSDQGAVCFPSRTMLLSGKSLFHLKPGTFAHYDNTFPRVLRTAGYETYHHGKKGNGPRGIYAEFEHEKYLVNDDDERRSGFPGKEIADAAVAFFKSRDKSRPFFMYLAFGNPHDPRIVNKAARDRYDESRMQLPINYRPLHPFDNGWMTGRDERLASWPRTEAEIRKHLTDYYGVITYLDGQIGRILDALEDTGEGRNTLIVFTSDHGLAIGSHGLMGKQNLYEHSMKPPLIFVGPKIRPERSNAFVYLYDIFPTICDLIGVDPPKDIDGRSFVPVLRRQSNSARDAIFLAFAEVQRAVRQGNWKLIRYPRVNVSQLFNLHDDPAELHDLSDTYPERTREMLDLLAKLQSANGDHLPLTAAHPDPAPVTAAQLRERARKERIPSRPPRSTP